MTVGERIKGARADAGVSRADLARRTGLAYSTISDLELGRSKSTSHIAEIADVLSVSPLWLQTGRGTRNKGVPQFRNRISESNIGGYVVAPQPYDSERTLEFKDLLDILRTASPMARRAIIASARAIASTLSQDKASPDQAKRQD